jgi:hypothetical protein
MIGIDYACKADYGTITSFWILTVRGYVRFDKMVFYRMELKLHLKKLGFTTAEINETLKNW